MNQWNDGSEESGKKKIIILFEIDLFHVLLTQLTYLGQSRV